MLTFGSIIREIVHPASLAATAVGGTMGTVMLKLADPSVDLWAEKVGIGLAIASAHVLGATVIASRRSRRHAVQEPRKRDI